VNDFIPVLRDRLIFIGWVVGLILIASLLWSLSFSFRARCLMQPVNKTLAIMEDERRLSVPLARHTAQPAPLGCWYYLAGNSDEPETEAGKLFFVFAIIRDGIMVPCGAEITEQGNVAEIIPLGSHARQVMGRIPQGIIQVYTERIESAALSLLGEI